MLIVKGSAGKVGVVPSSAPEPGEGGWVIGQSAIILRVESDEIDPHSLFTYLRSNIGQSLLKNITADSTIPFIKLSDLKELQVVIPETKQKEEISKTLKREDDISKQIKKLQKKIVVDRTVISKYFPTVNRMKTLNEVASLFYEFNKLLKDENEISEIFNFNQIVDSLKENYTFCWLEFNKFLFVFTNNWRKEVKDLETYSIGLVVMINAAMDKNFREKNINMKSWQEKVQGTDERGVNAMSLSDITGIPRPTVVRKLKYLVKNNYLVINEKKLVSINMKGPALKKGQELQDKNMLSLSNYIYIVFNQIKIINSGTDDAKDNFVPSYLRGF